jgi:hypothetical protein
MLFALPLLALLLTPASHAAEADNFTARSLNVADVASPINILANGYVRSAVDAANATGRCDEEALYAELRKYFANHSKGELAKTLLFGHQIPVTVIPIKESIYREWTVFDGYLLGRKKAAASPLALSPVVRVGDQIVGVDKFEHMFGMGWIYFDHHYRNGKSLLSVMKNGIFREKTALGGNVLATGVFSYADLSANFNGMRFWNHVLQKQDDVLGKAENLGPYVRCEGGKWVANPTKPLDFRNYMDASMDESVNCSKFARKAAVEKVRRSLVRLSFADAKGRATCPVEPDKLEEMAKKYAPGDIDRLILNSDGTGTVKYLSEFAERI